MSTNPTVPFISQSEAARSAGVSKQRIYQLLESGRLRSVDLQGRRYVMLASFRTYLQGRAARAVVVDPNQLVMLDE